MTTGPGERGRLLHVVTTAQRRGAETFGVRLADGLGRRGWPGSVVALLPGGPAPALDVPVLMSRWPGPRGLLALRRLGRRVDVVVAHGSRTLPAAAAALAGTGVPFVYVNIGDPAYWADTPGRRLRMRAALSRAAGVAALTDAAAGVLTGRFGVPADRVRVIPNGRPAADYPPADRASRAAARRRLGLPSDAPVVAYVGALTPEKCLADAVTLAADLPDVHVVLAGDGPERERLAELARRVAPARVHLVGPVRTSTLAFHAADAAILTSRSEGLPGVLIEAAFAGLPAVATDVGWVRDVVVDGVTGRLVPPGDRAGLAEAVGRVLGDAGAMGVAARRHCLERFEMDRVLTAWEGFLAAVAPPAAAGRRAGVR